MEMWIRSQSREQLEKINKIDLVDCTQLTKTLEDMGSGVFELLKANGQMNQYLIDGFAIKGNESFLGTYSTKERALEVLDEIQKILMPKGIMKFDAIYTAEDMQKLKEKNQDFIVIDNKATIERISDQLVYEMPKE